MASSEDEQIRYLAEGMKSVKEHAFYMKRAMDGDNMKGTLEHATNMLRELRTNLLTPKSYYELYMKILDEMRELEDYFSTLQKSGKGMSELYDRVQACNTVLPRLYLMCCVGGVYIVSKEVPAKDILMDLIEMIKGVQHPMRGLFLRHYLSHVTKNRLPDVGSPYESDQCGIRDALDFVIKNFQESNRLWVRMQNQGASKERRKREKERQDLRILVGTNLVRLSQLEGLDVEEYKENILPRILEQITDCKDTIAQSYLMDCIIQVFPDDFHLVTLETLLQTCTLLKEKVNVRTVLEALMERLSNYYVIIHSGQGSGEEVIDMSGDVNAFTMLNDCISSLIEERASMTLSETLRLQAALTNFAMKCHPDRIDYISHCLNNCVLLAQKGGLVENNENESVGGELPRMSREEDSKKPSVDDAAALTQLESLLLAILPFLGLKVLDLPPFLKLIKYLAWGSWKEVAASLLRGALSQPTATSILTDVAQVERLFGAIIPLLKDQKVASADNAAAHNIELNDNEEEPVVPPVDDMFRSEQLLVARIVHLLRNADTDVLMNMYSVIRNHFSQGGAQRMEFTVTPLVFAYLSLVRKIWVREKEKEAAAEAVTDNNSTSSATSSSPKIGTRKVFQLVMETIAGLANRHALMAFKLYLQAAQAADQCDFSPIAYEFAKEALLLYECEVTESKTQVRAVTSMIGTMLNCKHLNNEDYEALITKAAQYSNKLLKKPDQCRMVTLCSHLFWPDGGLEAAGMTGRAQSVDPERVLECMQRALKIASTCSPQLYVDIIDRYVYYFEKNHPSIHEKYLTGLIALTKEQLSSSHETTTSTGFGSIPTPPSSSQTNAAVETHYRNTLAYIRARQQLPETMEAFSKIEIA
eukprot:gene1296-2508_t